MTVAWELIALSNFSLFVFAMVQYHGLKKEIKIRGFKNFISDDWFGFIDFLSTGLIFIYVPIRLAYVDVTFPNGQEVTDLGHFTLIMLLNQTITILFLLKLFHAIKMMDKFFVYATLIEGCVADMIPFSFFLMLLILLIAFLRMIVGAEVRSHDYPLVPNAV